jgi:hypothetical protein
MGTETAQRVVARFKSALDVPNPLVDMNRPKAVRYLYKLIGRVPDGIFSDNSWRPIHKIFEIFRKNGIDYVITDTEYFKDAEGRPNAKKWRFEIASTNKRGRPQTIYGTITAAGAGSVDDPLDKYDVTVVLD